MHIHVPTCIWEDQYTGPHVGPPSVASLCPYLPHCHPPMAMQPLPAGVIGLIGRQHPVHSGSYLTVTGDIPQPIGAQD